MRDDEIDTGALRRGRRMLALAAGCTVLFAFALRGNSPGPAALAWGAGVLSGVAGAWAISRGCGIGPFCRNLGLAVLALPLLILPRAKVMW